MGTIVDIEGIEKKELVCSNDNPKKLVEIRGGTTIKNDVIVVGNDKYINALDLQVGQP